MTKNPLYKGFFVYIDSGIFKNIYAFLRKTYIEGTFDTLLDSGLWLCIQKKVRRGSAKPAWYPLDPLLHYMPCPQCGIRKLFYASSFPAADGSVGLLSVRAQHAVTTVIPEKRFELLSLVSARHGVRADTDTDASFTTTGC
jgi:hypothetical protein